uniref:CTCK domain-containing protein n=1 Tax=Paramormyrops kingsleyae TaxID=1676925 RepID=A0A3B3QBC5_9TELE
MRMAVARPVSKSDTISIGAPVICCKFQNKYSLPHTQRPRRWVSHLPHTETSSFAGTPIQNCNLMKNSSILVHNTCQSADPVELSSCTGYCGTYSLYSANANDLVHSCSCCQETSVSKKQVQLVCPDGSTMDYTYTYIESCSCSPVNCATTAAGK